MPEHLICECPKCGYQFRAMVGMGYFYPSFEYDPTVEEAKAGKLGREIQQFFEEHPTGVINAEKVVGCCTSCGEYESIRDLTMYIPDMEKIAAKTDRVEFIPFTDEDYEMCEKYMDYPHKCSSCGGRLRILTNRDFRHGLKCPNCSRKLKFIDDGIIWD